MEHSVAAEEARESEDLPTLRVIAQTARPVEVGDLVLDENGLLQHREKDQPVRFRFTYQGYAFAADVPAEPGNPLVLRATLGIVPYSAESVSRRRIARQILSRARLPRGRFVQDNHSRIHVEMWLEPPRPRTPANVVATVIALLTDARPYLSLFEVALHRPRHRV